MNELVCAERREHRFRVDASTDSHLRIVRFATADPREVLDAVDVADRVVDGREAPERGMACIDALHLVVEVDVVLARMGERGSLEDRLDLGAAVPPDG